MISLWIALIETSFAKIYTLLIGAAILVLTARYLGPENQGIVTAATSWAMLCSAFGGLSLGQVAHYRRQVKNSDLWLIDLFGPLLLLTGILTLLTFIIIIITYSAFDSKVFGDISLHVLLIAFAIIPFSIWEDYSKNLLAANDKLRVYNMAQLCGRTFWLAGILGLIYFSNIGICEVLITQLLGQAIVALIGFSELKKHVNSVIRIRLHEIKELLKGAVKLHFNTIGAFLLAQNTILMLNFYSTKVDVGYYQIAFQLVMLPVVISQSASMVIYTKMSDLGPDGIWPLQKRLGLQILVVVSLIAILAYLAAPLLINLLVGKDYDPSIRIFRMLLPCVFGMTLAQIMTPQWIGRGVFITNTVLTFSVAVMNVAINTLMIPHYGLIGAVWSSLVCYAGITSISQLLFAWWCNKQYIKSLSI